MENDKERQAEREIQTTHAAEGEARGASSKDIPDLPPPKKSGDGSMDGPPWEKVRRLLRRGKRVAGVQFAELRRAYLDLRLRIGRELGSQSIVPEQKASPGAPAEVKKEKISSVSFAIRPAGLAEPAMKFRRVLVVGGMDFFGTALVRHLNRRGLREIVIADNLENERWKNLPSLRFEEFLSREELAAGLGSGSRPLGAFSHVFYLAGWDENPSPLALPKSVLSHLVENGGRFISLGSASSLGPHPKRKDLARGRPENFRPETRSGVMANLFDRHGLTQLSAKNYLSLKHFRLFGPHERRDDSIYGLAKMLHEQITETGVALLPENLHPDSPEGIRRHDFLYVRDAARIATFLAENEEAAGLYELGSGTSSTVSDLVHAVFEALGRKAVIKWVQPPCALPSPEPEKADLARLHEAGWTPQPASLDEGLRDYFDNFMGVDLPLEAEEDEVVPAARGEKIVLSPVVPPARIFPARKKPFSPKTTPA